MVDPNGVNGAAGRFEPDPTLVVAGLYVVLGMLPRAVLGARLTLPLEDNLLYLLLGLAVPGIALAWALRGPRRQPLAAAVLSAVLTVVGVGLAAWIGLRAGPVAVAAALAAAVLQAGALLRFAPPDERRGALIPGMVGAGLLGWAAAIVSLPEIRYGSGWSDWPVAAAATAIAALVACWWSAERGAPSRHRILSLGVDLLAGAAIIALSFRTDGLFVSDGPLQNVLAMHHFGVFTGPAMMVRDGGWLYWDVPSQYGFLSILSIAAFPSTTWQATYLLSAMMTAMMVAGVYIAVRGVRRGIAGQVFALAVATGLYFAVMLTDGTTQHHYFPSIGGMRYLWSIVLIGMLALERRTAPGSARQRAVLVAGTVVWLVSLLWAADCALYATVVWFPGYLIAVFRDRAAEAGRLDLRIAAGWLLLPVGLFAAALAVIAASYVFGQGHLPDPLGYVDTAIAFGDSQLGSKAGRPLSLEREGLVALAAVQVLALTGVIAVLIRRLGWPREIGILIGSGAMLWSWTGYVLTRKASEGGLNSLPAAVIAAAVCLGILIDRRRELPLAAAWGYRAVALPLLALVAVALLSRPSLVAIHADLFSQPSTWRVTDVTAGLPEIDPELAQLLSNASATPDDPLNFAGNFTGNLMNAWTSDGVRHDEFHALTPNFPFILTTVLAPERRVLYMDRMNARSPRAGWVIQLKQDGQVAPQYLDDTGPWFWEQLFRTHAPTRAYASEHWDLVWVEPAGPDRVRPELRDGRWMLDDRLVEAESAGVLASWGPGALDERGDGSATIADGTVLNLYSDKARTVRLAFDGSVRRGYELVFEGSPAGLVDPPDRNGNMVELALPAGWSQLVFTAAPAEVSADPAARSRVSRIRFEPLPRPADRGGPARGEAQNAPKPAVDAATPEPDQQQKRDQDPDRPRRDRRDANGNQRATPAAPES